MALDLDTDKVRWVFQAEPNDATLGGCATRARSKACPEHPGPDWDFGASPILKTLANGHDLLLAPNKSGIVFALDPDRKGAVVWKTNLSERRDTRDKPCLGRLGRSAESLRWINERRDHLGSVRDRRKGLDNQAGATGQPGVKCGGKQRYPGRRVYRRHGWEASRACVRRWAGTVGLRYSARVYNRKPGFGEWGIDRLHRTDDCRRHGFHWFRVQRCVGNAW
jgi:hypothetical protein